MSERMEWMVEEGPEIAEMQNPHFSQKQGEVGHPHDELELGEGDAGRSARVTWDGCSTGWNEYEWEIERQRRIYRKRTVGMLRRYMQYSLETGRMPSILGSEYFRTQVTSYSVVTFEDRVIFAHDMEKCLGRLDEFSRQLIARRVLEEHDLCGAAKLLHCTERTVRRLMPVALDLLAEILLDLGLLERLELNCEKSCQGGLEDENSVSDCEDAK